MVGKLTQPDFFFLIFKGHTKHLEVVTLHHGVADKGGEFLSPSTRTCFLTDISINWQESCVLQCVYTCVSVYVPHIHYKNLYICVCFNTHAILKSWCFLRHSPVRNACRFDFVYDNDLLVTAHRGSKGNPKAGTRSFGNFH